MGDPLQALDLESEFPTTDRQRSRGERDQAGDQPAGEKQRDILAARKRRSNDSPASLDQGRQSRKSFPANNLRTAHAGVMRPTKPKSALSIVGSVRKILLDRLEN